MLDGSDVTLIPHNRWLGDGEGAVKRDDGGGTVASGGPSVLVVASDALSDEDGPVEVVDEDEGGSWTLADAIADDDLSDSLNYGSFADGPRELTLCESRSDEKAPLEVADEDEGGSRTLADAIADDDLSDGLNYGSFQDGSGTGVDVRLVTTTSIDDALDQGMFKVESVL